MNARCASAPLTGATTGVLLREARQLASRATDSAHAPLEGTHLALLCGESAFVSGAAFIDAARGLGARVAHLRPLRTAADPALRMLGQLYRAVCCEGMAARQVTELARLDVLPVLADLASPHHPSRLVGDLLALQAAQARPDTALRLGLVSDPDSELAQAWQEAAGEADVALEVVCQPTLSVVNTLPSHGRRAERLDLWCDPALPRCDDGRPVLWQLPGRAATQPPRSLAQEQQRQHRYVVQALLLRALH